MNSNTKEAALRKESKKTRRKSVFVPLLIAIPIGMLIAAYIGIAVYYCNHIFPGTTINGQDYAGLTIEEAERQMREATAEYRLTIVGRESAQVSISAKDISLEVDMNEAMSEVNEDQSGFLWFTSIFTGKDYLFPQIAEYNEKELNSILDGLSIFNASVARVPKDAYISKYSEENKGVTIVDEDKGTTLKKEETVSAIKDAISSMQTELNLEELDLYENPAITSDDESLTELCNNLNQYMGACISYQFGDSTEVVDGNIIQDWLDIDGTSVQLDEEALDEYVKQLASSYNTYGKNRTITTTDGQEKTLRSGGYGWRIDTATEEEALKNSILSGEVVTKEPAYLVTAAYRGEDNDDIGPSYVEINLSAQHLYVYIDSAIVFESDLVSGNVSKAFTTPEGVFGLTYKTKDAVLKGENYETPVNYWMPFNGNIGMHDATWRSEFGGDIYLTSGSHGCINLPLDSAATIYGYVFKGMPVVCYY